MAFTTAQLASSITASQLQFNLTNISTNQSGLPPVGALPLPVGNPMQIDAELMYVVSQPTAGNVIVRGRGTEGAAVAHDILSNVCVSATPGDFPVPGVGQTQTLDPANDAPQTIGQDGTLVIPVSNTIYNINKVTALALVLPAPPVTLNGLTLVFTSNTAVAHVITATNLYQDGTGTLPHSTATFNSKQGASMIVTAENGLWNFASPANNVTIS